MIKEYKNEYQEMNKNQTYILKESMSKSPYHKDAESKSIIFKNWWKDN